MDTILYVDDEEINLELFEIHFCTHFKVLTSVTTDDAINKLQNNNIKLFITDFKMPVMNGIELIKVVKKIAPDLKCCILSGYVESEIISVDDKGLYNGFFVKPWNKELLLNSINKIIVVR